MIKYEPSKVEAKWQKKWREAGKYRVDLSKPSRKFYLLVEFTYPSGDLHMGHWFAFAVPDILARMKRMQGFSVFTPNGFDAFGLPAENAAISRKIHPRDWTLANIARMKQQFATMGAIYDWEHEVITCDPEYYRWNQWIFLKMYEKGLAYRTKASANWCPKDQCVLANENVENGRCWRCGSEVVQKEIEQWFLKITDYAEKLLWSKKAKIDWPKSLREAQNNWIGKSEGVVIKFKVSRSPVSDIAGPAGRHPRPTSSLQSNLEMKIHKQSLRSSSFDELRTAGLKSSDAAGARRGSPAPVTRNVETATPRDLIEVFTTRVDTLFGATFLVLAPEHPIVASLLNSKLKTQNSKLAEIREYIKRSQKKSELERKENKGKTGVFTGAYAINPVNREEIPIWIADYALMGYGTGALFGDAHDERDVEFARRYKIPLRPTLIAGNKDQDERIKNLSQVFTGDGILFNSGKFSGLKSAEAREKITAELEKTGAGFAHVTYHLRDWSISRQRYWGTPIPVIYCDKCGTVPVPEKDLPVELPYEVDFAPKGKPPLATAEDWVKVKCPNCGGDGRREVETMDTFVDSSWYFLRYLDPKNKKQIADKKALSDWMPVDIYFGGAEHTLGHTLYSRFFVKFLQDVGTVPQMAEYAKKRIQHGVILGSDGQRMSKSHGNVVNPDEVVKQYGADAVRLYLAFLGPYDLVAPWDPGGIHGVYNFLTRVWRLIDAAHPKALLSDEDKYQMNRAIKKVGHDIESIKFNTAVSTLMQWLNHLSQKAHSNKISVLEYKTFLKILAPMAPHITEELWEMLEEKGSIHSESWPNFDPKLATAKMITLVVQINGKVRDRLPVEAGISQKDAEELALNSPRVQKYLDSKKPRKVIFVEDRLINFVL